ncbi:MAG: hypothetical protein WCX95_04530, partial [Candidatus Gracilibacteria bacterium]
MRLTVENLAKMEQYGHKFSELLTLTTGPEKEKFDWVKDALRYVMGLPGEGQSTVSANEGKVHEDIARALENPLGPKDTPEPNFSYGCTILAFAKPEQRKAIVEIALGSDALQKRAQGKGGDLPTALLAEKKSLLTILCNQGAVSPLEADEYLGKAAFSDQEMQEMGQLWEEKFDYIKRSKYLVAESYGAKNMANEMLSVGNILTTFGYVAGTMTILMNGICNWKTIKEDPVAFLKIPQVWIGAAEIAAATYSDSEQTLGEISAGKETVRDWDTKKSRDGILSVISASPRGWNAMLDSDESFGVKALAEFVATKNDSDGEFKAAESTVVNFKTFLEEKELKTSNKSYGKILAQMKTIETSENNADMTSTRFLKLTTAFSKLKIVGDGNVVETYQANLAAAEGKELPTAPTKQT